MQYARTLAIGKIRLILALWQAGHPIKATARAVQVNPKTVRRYVALAAGQSNRPMGHAALPDSVTNDLDRLLALVLVADHTRRAANDRQRLLLTWQHRIEQALSTHRSMASAHCALRDQGLNVSYATLRRFCVLHLGWRVRKPRTCSA